MAADRDAPSPTEQVARLYEQAESEAAKASERDAKAIVSGEAFGLDAVAV